MQKNHSKETQTMFYSAGKMPTINMEILKTILSESEYNIASGIVAKHKDGYRLKTTKPKTHGPTQYVWRMVAYIASTIPAHHCMPVGADFYLNDMDYAHREDKYIPRQETEQDRETVKNWDEKTWERMHNGTKRRQYIKQELEPIIDKIIDTIPKNNWHGAKRWANALYG